MSLNVRPDERIDELIVKDYRLIQPLDGYRFSIDPVLLCSFVQTPLNVKVIDLGTGNGIIPVLLAATKETSSIVGIEIQADMVDRARRSVSLNNLEQKVEIRHADIRQIAESFSAETFDVAVTNPPYRQPQSGRHAKGEERLLARHEVAGDLKDFLSAAKYLLKSGGWFYIVYLAERLTDLVTEMRAAKLEPKRMRLVHSRDGDDASLVLVEGRRNGRPGLTVEPPLVIYVGPGREYSPEVQNLFKGSLSAKINKSGADVA